MPDKRLQQWWDGLSSAEREEALQTKKSDRLSAKTEKSLKNAGLLRPGEKPTSRDAIEFLKMRH